MTHDQVLHGYICSHISKHGGYPRQQEIDFYSKMANDFVERYSSAKIVNIGFDSELLKSIDSSEIIKKHLNRADHND